MNDNKAFAIIVTTGIVCGAIFLSIVSITSKDVDISKEKTEQLKYQFKIDSLAKVSSAK